MPPCQCVPLIRGSEICKKSYGQNNNASYSSLLQQRGASLFRNIEHLWITFTTACGPKLGSQHHVNNEVACVGKKQSMGIVLTKALDISKLLLSLSEMLAPLQVAWPPWLCRVFVHHWEVYENSQKKPKYRWFLNLVLKLLESRTGSYCDNKGFTKLQRLSTVMH